MIPDKLLKHEINRVLDTAQEKRAWTIIESPYSQQILDHISTQDSYLIIKSAWGTDSQILLQYIQPEKICSFIDLDCWENDTLSIQKLIAWLWELLNTSPETLAKTLDKIDIELIVLLLQSYLEVVQLSPTDENIPDLINAGFETLDDIYYIRFFRECEENDLLKSLMNIILDQYPGMYFLIMDSIQFEFSSNMLEQAYQNHTLRLIELGFPEREEAMLIYKRASIKNLIHQGIQKQKIPHLEQDEYTLPALYHEHLSHSKEIVFQALDKTDFDTQQRFLFEMVYLTNKIIVADYRPINEVEEIQQGLSKAKAITSLGLEIAEQETNLPLWRIIKEINAETLFSLGYNAIIQKQKRLKKILKTIDLSLIPSAYRDFVEGLLSKRPRYLGHEYSSLAQINTTDCMLDRLESMISIIETLDWRKELSSVSATNLKSDQEIDLENIIITTLALNILEGKTNFRPLGIEETLSFLKLTTKIGADGQRRCVPGLVGDAIILLETLAYAITPEVVSDTAKNLIARLEDEIAGLQDIQDLDPRFISCLVIELPL